MKLSDRIATVERDDPDSRNLKIIRQHVARVETRLEHLARDQGGWRPDLRKHQPETS